MVRLERSLFAASPAKVTRTDSIIEARVGLGPFVGDDHAVADPDYPPGIRRDLVLVGDEHDRPSVVAAPLEDPEDLLARGGVEVPDRLIGEDQGPGW